MSEWDGFDDLNDENAEAAGESAPAEKTPAAEVVVESVPAEEEISTDEVVPYNGSPYGDNPYNPYGGQMPPGGSQGSLYNNGPYNNPYGSQYTNQYNGQYNNGPYNNNQYNSSSYSSNQYNNNPYSSNPYNNNPYNSPYNNNPYSNSQYSNNQYTNTQYGNSPYGNNPYGQQTPPSGSQGSLYNNNPHNNQYGSQYNNQYNNPYNNSPYNNHNPYSPYAVPPQKNKNGLVIGIVIGIVVLLSIAVFALIYRAVTLFGQANVRIRSNGDEYQFDYDADDWGVNRFWSDNDPDYDDDWNDYYDDNSRYYELHDDIRGDLSYSVDVDYYEYDTDNENVDIWAEYPIIQGRDVPNLDKLNGVIRSEVDSYISYFEEEYEEYITGNDYYEASITGYVTYMDEDKISIVFDERVYSDEYSGYIDFYLYCINIDMENGVVLENQNMLRIDDDFSVDFRERSDIQNGESYYMSMMSDQEITDYFNSANIIVFYTPMGMEIGFNYEEGWITVTYSEYEQYLKVF